jgi:hypothetical protein
LSNGLGGGGLADEVGRINASEDEEQLGVRIEPGTYAIERRGDVLAQVRPIRAGAVQVNLLRSRE